MMFAVCDVCGSQIEVREKSWGSELNGIKTTNKKGRSLLVCSWTCLEEVNKDD